MPPVKISADDDGSRQGEGWEEHKGEWPHIMYPSHHPHITKENMLTSQRRGLLPDPQTARALIKKLGGRLNVVLTPHDPLRYSAAYASRNGVPLEIVSKVILVAICLTRNFRLL
jgi:hypothetical protein